MKFIGTILLVSVTYLASLVCSVSAEGLFGYFPENNMVSTISPPPSTIYQAGSEVTILWTDPKVETIPLIVLGQTRPDGYYQLREIATNVNARDLKYVWKIPLEIDNGKNYYFELIGPQSNDLAGPFSIEGGVGSVDSVNDGSTFRGSFLKNNK